MKGSKFLTMFSGGGVSYVDKIKALFGANLLVYFPMSETSGTTMEDQSGNGRDGSYSNVTLDNTLGPDGENNAPLFVPGSLSYASMYSNSFRDAFDGAEGSFIVWVKVREAAVWTDSNYRFVIRVQADGSNYYYINKYNGNNQMFRDTQTGGTRLLEFHNGISDTDWILLGLTWSAAADEIQTYKDNATLGALDTGLGTWAGTLNSAYTLLGADDSTPTQVWDGWISHAMVLDRPFTLAEFQEIWNMSNP